MPSGHASVGAVVGDAVGPGDGASVGAFVGSRDGDALGPTVGDIVGAGVSHRSSPSSDSTQLSLVQSAPTKHRLPGRHGGHALPPQSTDVSSSPFTSSTHVAGVGLSVGAELGDRDGLSVGLVDGRALGFRAALGTAVYAVGKDDGAAVGDPDDGALVATAAANDGAAAAFEEYMKAGKAQVCPHCKEACEKEGGCNFMYCKCKLKDGTKGKFCLHCGRGLDEKQHISHFGKYGPYGEGCVGGKKDDKGHVAEPACAQCQGYVAQKTKCACGGWQQHDGVAEAEAE